MKKQLGLEVLDYPFLGYREIMAVLKLLQRLPMKLLMMS